MFNVHLHDHRNIPGYGYMNVNQNDHLPFMNVHKMFIECSYKR